MSPTPQRRCDCKAGGVVRLFEARDYISGDRFEIIQCSTCGLAFTEPVPTEAEWHRYYPAFYYGNAATNRFPVAVEWLQNRLYASRARKLETLAGRKPGRVLDISCGRGHLLRALQRRGWQVIGTEMSEAAASYARNQLNLPVQVGKLGDLKLPEASFDVVIMWHVLEHFEHAKEALREVFRLLRPRGVFLVAVPNFGSPEAQVARDKWFHLDVPRHLTHFSQSALNRSLEQAGFRAEAMSSRSLEYDFFSAAQSFLNRIGLQQNWLYNALRGERGRSKGQLLAHLLCLPTAIIPGITALLAGGSTLVVYARKP